tara:strand:- start:3972 stop:5201 length:1230 start_codon:yes stop_codon:yes gene_type:complete
MEEVNKSANLIAYCVAIFMATLAFFSLTFLDESFDEDWYRENSTLITAGSIIFCLVSMGFYFKNAGGGGFIDSRMVLFIAILGYLFDWVSLTNDITRFTEEDKYNWGGKETSFVTGQSGRVNSTITGNGAMLADVLVLYSSSAILFGSKCKKCYKSFNYNGILISLMVGLILWSRYLIKKYPQIEEDDVDGSKIEGSLKINAAENRLPYLVGIQLLFLLLSFVNVFIIKSQVLLHISLAIIGGLAIYILNATESKLNLIYSEGSGSIGSIHLLGTYRKPSSIIPYLLYGNNMTRARFNGIVIFLNILLGWQNFWYTYYSDIEAKALNVTKAYNLVTTFISDLVIPSVLNFINTNGQLAINADDLKIPRDFDSDGNSENFGTMIRVMLSILFVIFASVWISEKKRLVKVV